MAIESKLPKLTLEDIDHVNKDLAVKLDKKWKDGLESHRQRCTGFDFFARIAHNLSLFERKRNDSYSEGSTQTIRRKIRSQTIQRVPDGEIVTPYDKNSIEQVIIDYLYKHKILTSEYDGKDMMKQLWKTFDNSYIYGAGCVRTGFEKDLDGDPRVSYTLIPYNDVIPSPDCKFIEEADWYIIREYVPITNLKMIFDCETGTVSDNTYDADVVRYIIENETKDGAEWLSIPLADRKKGVSYNHSVEVRTYYCRGADEFISYVPGINAILRKVPNYDPRKDVPIHFLILEPNPEFPYGCSSVMWTIAQQQYADAFQSTAYQTLLLSLRPPMQVFGNLTNPKIKMKPGAIWPMGTNPNNHIDPYRVETTTLTQYGSILESISAKMMSSLNITDATVASDANVPHYSATPQGVEQQHQDKTITINQYQKRVEVFFSEWANHAIRSYINAMSGKVEMTVDAKTRKRIESIEQATRKQAELDIRQTADPMTADEVLLDADLESETIIHGNKVEIDFDVLHDDALFNFEVRSGSLIENEREVERNNIQEMLVSVSQMIGNISDANKNAFENIIMQLVLRLCELSDVDISASISSVINEQLIMGALQTTMDAVANQQGQIQQMQQAMGMMPPEAPMAAGGLPQGGMPPEVGGAQPEIPLELPPDAMAQPQVEAGGMPEDMMLTAEEPMPEEEMVM